MKETSKNTFKDSEPKCDDEVKTMPLVVHDGRHGRYDSDVAEDSDLGDDSNELFMSQKSGIPSVNVIKKSQRFESKKIMKSTMEMCAVKYNFDYKVVKSDSTCWNIRCKDNICNWSVRAMNLASSTYFIITKYVSKHTCAPSSKTNSGKTPSAKTIGRLIMNKYEGVKDGPKPNDVIQLMRTEYGVEILYSLAFDACEYAVNMIRGIPEKSYGKIPKYLYMLKTANPGTHYDYVTDFDGRFKYLFLSFGQSIRGFHKKIWKVVVVDETFLKNKFKGVLLVATALDRNSNLYPIAFGVVDSENDSSWEWFMRHLNIVIPDDHGLAFVSDRLTSIVKSLEKVYPHARHGICIHHLISNVVTGKHGKGVAHLVAEASKVYREAEFRERFTSLCNISPTIGKYLIEADVKKWARCLFPGFRYDIRTTNPTESINSALRSLREYPIIHLLDNIREMLTRWFHKRRIKSSKHSQPLTVKVEKKVVRRIEKGKTFIVYPINKHQFHVTGDTYNCLVDLNARTCTCGKYDLVKIPCRQAIRAGLSIGRDTHSLTDAKYTTVTWRSTYEECINPIADPEDSWRVPQEVELAKVLPPETRRAAGRRRKRRYESVEDKIRSSQGPKGTKRNKCSRCYVEGHNRATCDMPI